MQHTSWNWPADANGLPELLKLFGCADVIAPVDYVGFGRITGELITRVVFGKRAGALLIRPVSDGQYVARNLPKIDRVPIGGPRHVRMPSTRAPMPLRTAASR